MTCTAKHTKYQPRMPEEWACPKCGAGAQTPEGDGWIVQDPADGSGDCDLNHDADTIGCYRCEYGCTGAAFARRLQKAANMVPCEHCKGSGLVKKETP